MNAQNARTTKRPAPKGKRRLLTRKRILLTLHAGLAAVEPGNGAVVAMYGGKDYTKVQLNSATAATMQAGSTFKPFGLIAALQQGISTHTTFPVSYTHLTLPTKA